MPKKKQDKFINNYKCYPKNINNLKDVCDALATAPEGRDKINAFLFLNPHYLICVGTQGEGYKVDLPFESSLNSAYKSLYDWMMTKYVYHNPSDRNTHHLFDAMTEEYCIIGFNNYKKAFDEYCSISEKVHKSNPDDDPTDYIHDLDRLLAKIGLLASKKSLIKASYIGEDYRKKSC